VAPHQGRRGVAVAMLRVTLTPATCPTCGCSSNSRTKCGSACWPLESVFTTTSHRSCNPPPATPHLTIGVPLVLQTSRADGCIDRPRHACVSHGFKEDLIGVVVPRTGKVILSMPGFFLARGGGQSEKFNLPPTEPREQLQLSGARRVGRSGEGE